MPKIDRPKKPARGDWPSYLIVFKLREKHTSLRRLSRLNGYAPGAASVAMSRPWPFMESLIARTIGVSPQTIWPSRYRPDGTPKSGRGERGIGRYRTKNSARAGAVNVEKTPAF